MIRISASRAAFVASLLAIGCDSATTISGPLVARVRLSKDTATLVVTQTLALTATPLDAHGNVVVGLSTTWSSNAPGVATVAQDGTVMGVAAGIAIVTGTIAGRSSVMRLTVYDGAVIGPAGGIAATADSAVVLRIPAGALVDARQITLVPMSPTLPTFVTAVGRAYDLGPVETTFAQAATLRMRYQASSLPPGAGESSVKVARLTSNGLNFILLLLPGSTVDTVRHEITVPVSAFSLWVPVVPTTPVP